MSHGKQGTPLTPDYCMTCTIISYVGLCLTIHKLVAILKNLTEYPNSDVLVLQGKQRHT